MPNQHNYEAGKAAEYTLQILTIEEAVIIFGTYLS